MLSRALPAFVTSASGIGALAFSPDGNLLATTVGDADARVVLWVPGTGQRQRTLKAADGSEEDEVMRWFVRSSGWIAFSPDGRKLAARVSSSRINAWDLATGRLLADILLPGIVTTAGFRLDGRRFAVASRDGLVHWYDTVTWQRLRQVSPVPAGGTSIAALKRAIGGIRPQQSYDSMILSPGLRALATASLDGTVRLWNPETGGQQGAFQMLVRQPGEPKGLELLRGGPTIAGFSPDGNLLAIREADLLGGVELREAATGQLRHRFGGST